MKRFSHNNRLFALLAALAFFIIVPEPVSAHRSSFRHSINAIQRAIKTNTQKAIKPAFIVKSRYAKPMTSVACSSDDKYFVTAGENGSAQLWNSETGQKITDFHGNANSILSLAFSKDSKFILTGRQNGVINIWNRESGNIAGNLLGHSEKIYQLIPFTNGQLLSASADATIKMWNINSRTLIRSFSINNDAAVLSIAVSRDCKSLASGHSDGKIRTWDISSGKLLTTINSGGGPVYSMEISSGKVLATGLSNGEVKLWKFPSGEHISSEKRHDGPVRALAIHHDKAIIATAGDDTLLKFSPLGSGRITTLPGHEDKINSICFSQNGRFLLTASSDKTTRIWDREKAIESARLITMYSGWAVVSPDGFFDGTLDGRIEDRLDAVQWVVGDRFFSIDGFLERYYQPALLGRVLTRQLQKKQPDLPTISEGFPLPPTMKVSLQGLFGKKTSKKKKVTVYVEAVDQGGGIDEIKLFHNHKALNDADAKQTTEKQGDTKIITKEYEVVLIEGENIIKGVGFSDSRIESEAVEKVVEYKSEQAAPPAKLHLVTIGINKYKNSFLDLNFASPDAKSIADLFSKSYTTLFNELILYELYDGDATLDKINATLHLLEDISAEDTVVIYLAGHGEAYKNQWYFVPHDLHDMFDGTELQKKGISATTLQLMVVKINARKIVLLMDSCKSGAAVDAFTEFDDRKSFALLSRAAGIHVGAAATKEQYAVELEKLGHGLFTYTLLKGIQGAADNEPVDGNITVYEILKYIKIAMPQFIKEHGSMYQQPVVNSKGMNFTVAKTISAE